MLRINRERGPGGFLQIGSTRKSRAWVTFWLGGITMALPGGFALCVRSPRSRPYFSERNGIGVRHLIKFCGWRVFVRRWWS